MLIFGWDTLNSFEYFPINISILFVNFPTVKETNSRISPFVLILTLGTNQKRYECLFKNLIELYKMYEIEGNQMFL